ncbi:hypothetical protein HMPREF9374_0192, partial [Desmospora sp. 8437]
PTVTPPAVFIFLLQSASRVASAGDSLKAEREAMATPIRVRSKAPMKINPNLPREVGNQTSLRQTNVKAKNLWRASSFRSDSGKKLSSKSRCGQLK